jgi:hypothetical protein
MGRNEYRTEGIERRRREAAERAELRVKRTPQDQLDRLDRIFGKDLGAKKERAKLHKLLTPVEVKEARILPTYDDAKKIHKALTSEAK